MDVPPISLSFIADFTNAQGTARAALVRTQYRQHMQQEDRFWAFYYRELFDAVEAVVARQGDLQPLKEAVRVAPEKKQRSYAAAAEGLAALLTKLRPTAITRASTALWTDVTTGVQVRVRPHFVTTSSKGDHEAWFLNCKEDAFAPSAANVVLYLMQAHGPEEARAADPRLLNVRAAQSLRLRANVNREQIKQSLAAEAQTYRALWLANSNGDGLQD